MTNIEKAVIAALRLSQTAAERLHDEIDRNIRSARAELIRSGVSTEFAESEHPLLVDAIVTYCQSKMGDESNADRYAEAFKYQQDNLRKTYEK